MEIKLGHPLGLSWKSEYVAYPDSSDFTMPSVYGANIKKINFRNGGLKI
jgi:hypothetical protein